MDLAHLAAAVDEDRGREGEHAVELRQSRRSVVLVGDAGDQRGVLDAVSLAETIGRLGGTLEVAELLEHQRHHFEAACPIPLVQIDQQLRLVMAVRAPAAGERHHHDLALEELVAQRDIHAAKIREAEVETITGDELRRLVGIPERGVLVTPRREAVLEGDAGPELAGERIVRRERPVIEEHMAAVELREAQLAAAQFAGEDAMITGGCEEGAGDEATGLLQFTDRRRVLAAVDEGHGPAAAHIRCTGFRRTVCARAEAERVTVARAERDLLVFALGLHHQQRSRERIALELRIDAVVEARHAQRDRVAVHRDLVDPGALRSVDQVGDTAALLTHELDPERQFAARHLQHGAPDAVAWSVVGA